MRLFKHKDARDVAYEFIKRSRKCWTVDIYNINYAEISGKAPLYMCTLEIPKERINFKDFSPWVNSFK